MGMETGRAKIEWAKGHMPLLDRLRAEFVEERPFSGYRIGMSIHLEAKTASLAILLRDGGGEVWVTGSNPLSTQDDVAAALSSEERIFVRARHGARDDEYTSDLMKIIEAGPQLILDDGGDLVHLLHEGMAEGIIGGCEETTTGITRLRKLEREGRLRFPMFAVNDAKMKYLFDNRYGTGQSVWDAIIRRTNLLIAGKSVLVAGYGWCGRGIASRARGLGARVTVAEVDPIRAIEAWMDGFSVARLAEAIEGADILVTATGCIDVVTEEALKNARDGLILANAGHFNVEINIDDLKRSARSKRRVREGIDEYDLADGRRIYLLGEGRLVNLALGDGHPVEIMDISFAVQALTLRHLLLNRPLKPGLYPVPPEIDEKIARMKLASLNVSIDSLTGSQRSYTGKDG